MRNNTYTDIFQRTYSPEASHLVKNVASGSSFRMTMVLDSYDSVLTRRISGSFHIALNQKENFMNVRDAGVLAAAGYETIVKATPVHYVSSEDFQRQSNVVRDCKYHHENTNNQSIFK